MLSNVSTAPGDPIFALGDRCRSDQRADKIDLTVGIYKNAAGHVPLLDTVRTVRQQLAQEREGRSYSPIGGLEEYRAATQQLLFGADAEVLKNRRVATIQTVGGSGGLRIAADFLKAIYPSSGIWISNPPYANHRPIFTAASIDVQEYPYYDRYARRLTFEPMLDTIGSIPRHGIVLLHGCCHNPSGSDLDRNQWEALIEVMEKRDLLPLIDSAYQGFAASVDEDAWIVRRLAASSMNFIVVNSFSKNFSIYSERCGALSVVSDNAESTAAVLSNLISAVRRSYSSPPAHGARLVTEILKKNELRSNWLQELADMRERVLQIREVVHAQLNNKAPDYDSDYFMHQRGLFSLTDLSMQEIEYLRQEHAIYLVDSGRISLPGLNKDNVDRFTDAFASVLRQRSP